VNTRIDPILISTVCIQDGSKLESLLAKLTNGRPAEYYAQHIKNLGLLGMFLSSQNEEIDRILAICTGVENLALYGPSWGLNFLENAQAGRNLRRLSIGLEKFSTIWVAAKLLSPLFFQYNTPSPLGRRRRLA
jgi:hypothetical protein